MIDTLVSCSQLRNHSMLIGESHKSGCLKRSFTGFVNQRLPSFCSSDKFASHLQKCHEF